MQLEQLIDQASAIAGSDYKLAQRIGTTPQRVSNWRKEAQPCPIEDQALIAEVAGVDPVEQIIEALLERNADKPRAAKLNSLLRNWRKRSHANHLRSVIVLARNTVRHPKDDGRRLRTVNPKHHPLDARQVHVIAPGQRRH